jgi:hypothetical protein
MSTNGTPNLTQTRRELLNYLAQAERTESEASDRKQPRLSAPMNAASGAPGFEWSSLIEAGLSSWWHDHPARAGASLLKSATEEYARKKPVQVVTIAAVAGAAVVLLKPWRLVSASALMLSLFRSSNFTGMATSMLETAAHSMHSSQKERL